MTIKELLTINKQTLMTGPRERKHNRRRRRKKQISFIFLRKEKSHFLCSRRNAPEITIYLVITHRIVFQLPVLLGSCVPLCSTMFHECAFPVPVCLPWGNQISKARVCSIYGTNANRVHLLPTQISLDSKNVPPKKKCRRERAAEFRRALL